jgi:hypothetical protein
MMIKLNVFAKKDFIFQVVLVLNALIIALIVHHLHNVLNVKVNYNQKQVHVIVLHLNNLKILQILLVLIVILHLIFVFNAKIPKHV